MKREPTPGWRHLYIGAGDEVRVNGLSVWTAQRQIMPSVWLPHPQYPPQIHEFPVYELTDGNRLARIAMTELSNGCFCVYVPEEL